MSAREGRTVAELLDDSDGLAREALLDMSADRALGMVRGWPQLMQSAAELWAVLPPDPTVSANGDPIAILAAMGRAVGRSLAAGHWPGRGPRDEAWEQIASNFVQARRLLQEQPVASEAVSTDGQIGPTTANTQILHALYVAAHATTVALTGYQRDLQHRLEVGARRRQPFVERPTALEVESAGGMIARFDAIEQLAAGSLAARRINAADQPATGRRRPAMRLEAALAAWEIQAHRTLANHPDPADLVRVARVQALIATTTVVVSEAAARRGEIDAGVIDRLTPALENAQLAWSRSARRWAELTTPASRTDPALVEAAGQLRAAIRAAVANQTGWATPEQIAGRIDLPATAMTLHRSLVAGVELAYVTREIAADHPGLAAPARVIAMRAQGEAEVAIEQGETRFEGVRWVTPQQIAANQVIPLPEPARRGLINAATDVAAATNQAVAAAAHLSPPNMRRAREQTVLGVSAEPPRNARFRSIIRTEEVDHDEPNHIGSQWRRNRRGTAQLGTRMPFDRGCGGVVDQGPRREIRGAGSAMAADRRPRNHLARRTGHRAVLACRVLRRAPHFGTRRGPRTRQAARRCGRSLMASLDPYHLDLVLAVLRHRRLWQPVAT